MGRGQTAKDETTAGVAVARLLWLPVGAGGHVVRHASRWWELALAARQRRRPARLFHAALELEFDGQSSVIEMAPAWGVPAPVRGVVATGPVGLAPLGRSRYFRYEVRCWHGGVVPDRDWAVGDPVVLTRSAATVRLLVERVRTVPTFTWGRRAGRSGEMWNSNSLVAWLLDEAGIDAARLRPPGDGRAPGWAAGLDIARRGARPAPPDADAGPGRVPRSGDG